MIEMMNVPSGGRSVSPEDAEGWVLGPGTGTGTGSGAVDENTQSRTHVVSDSQPHAPKPGTLM